VPRHMDFRSIAGDIAARIASGEYPPDAQLPSYRQIADLYSVSISTAQRAILVLQERGLVYGIPGKGVFVRDQDEDQDRRG
jgi:GntR family transcriptional regulator